MAEHLLEWACQESWRCGEEGRQGRRGGSVFLFLLRYVLLRGCLLLLQHDNTRTSQGTVGLDGPLYWTRNNSEQHTIDNVIGEFFLNTRRNANTKRGRGGGEMETEPSISSRTPTRHMTYRYPAMMTCLHTSTEEEEEALHSKTLTFVCAYPVGYDEDNPQDGCRLLQQQGQCTTQAAKLSGCDSRIT